MVGENFEMFMSQMTKNVLKLSAMVAESFEIFTSQMAKNVLKLFTIIGENFEIVMSQLSKNVLLNCAPWLKKFLKIALLKHRFALL